MSFPVIDSLCCLWFNSSASEYSDIHNGSHVSYLVLISIYIWSEAVCDTLVAITCFLCLVMSHE